MCEPYDPFDFPDLPDEAVVAIDNFLTEFLTRFQDHYFAQMHCYVSGNYVTSLLCR